MSLEAFQDFLDQYGDDPAAWPDGQRAGAQALLAAVPAARQAFAEAAAIRALLHRRPVNAPAGLRHAIDRGIAASFSAPAESAEIETLESDSRDLLRVAGDRA